MCFIVSCMIEKLTQMYALCVIDILTCSCPFCTAFMNEKHLLTYASHRAHIVSVNDGGNAIFVSDIADKTVYDTRCYGV